MARRATGHSACGAPRGPTDRESRAVRRKLPRIRVSIRRILLRGSARRSAALGNVTAGLIVWIAGGCSRMIAESVSTAVSRSNGRRPQQHLVEDHAERKLIGGEPRGPASCLLGRHVAHGAENHSVMRERGTVMSSTSRRHRRQSGRALRQAEVQHLDRPSEVTMISPASGRGARCRARARRRALRRSAPRPAARRQSAPGPGRCGRRASVPRPVRGRAPHTVASSRP